MFGKSTIDYVRISKPRALKLHGKGIPVYIVPMKMNPDSPWGYAGVIQPEDDFDKVLTAYDYSNCNAETGKSCAFYAKYER